MRVGVEKIAVVGLGYVGLPVALAFAARFPGTVGYDKNAEKVRRLTQGVDTSGETNEGELKATSLRMSAEPAVLEGATFFVVAVPTPVDQDNRPDLSPVISATESVARFLRPGSVVVYESTVYPGVTEELCGGILERISGLRRGRDFKLGYSPERINPGDREHSLTRIVKIVSGEDAESLERVASVYGAIVEVGVFRAASIRVAEAAKVIENTQRDINIALMNELALIFDRMGIRTSDVLAAARTKWNFLNFTPGLVGGHCIGVDPYYLTTKAEQLGYFPQVILAGRRINNGMGQYVAQRLVKMLIQADLPVKSARVGILGLTFKENVPDVRNSRVPDIASELKQYGIEALLHDPCADAEEVHEEYGLRLSPLADFCQLDAVLVAVGHRAYLANGPEIVEMVRKGGVLVDVKGIIPAAAVRSDILYWAL